MNKLKISIAPFIRTKYSYKNMLNDRFITLIPFIIIKIFYFKEQFVYSYILVFTIYFMFSLFIKKYLKKEVFDINMILNQTTILMLILPQNLSIKYYLLSGIMLSFFDYLIGNLLNPVILVKLFFSIFLLNVNKINLMLFKYNIDNFRIKKNLFLGIFNDKEFGVILLILAIFYLKIKNNIKIRIPLITIIVTYVLFALKGYDSDLIIMSGPLLFSLVYLAADTIYSPYTKIGKIYYAVFIAILNFYLFYYTQNTDSIFIAILISNLLVPFFEENSTPISFGEKINYKKILKILLLFLMISIPIFSKVNSSDLNKIFETTVYIDRNDKIEGEVIYYSVKDIFGDKIGYITKVKYKENELLVGISLYKKIYNVIIQNENKKEILNEYKLVDKNKLFLRVLKNKENKTIDKIMLKILKDFEKYTYMYKKDLKKDIENAGATKYIE
ncbi:Na+-translocating ferredoxin:NAD+ oxidoreductase RnfD subunit [Hypnocyclicus thermotrophus]|uniref:Na+-translocating ferredoxin:NAD+ oxidoreductase RnfD subunit n=1 Tax=Hypnocyclicus thermotrophus TaxID=1627895 RepID=A0AA46DXX5_9FUSO|nr:RnfABCDGE type electron transport complex subunit D [Hypnocyclicus thermotrophus]TDT69179.1 Na+-translocating ferredoxin:NAD+ oxidoreductase RnfD subunit [Hypnocyclicus thermotrophus]